MAYAAGDYKLVIRGTFDNGETWSNTWAFHQSTPHTLQDDIDAFHDFYTAVYALLNGISDNTHATTATVKDLDTDELTDMVWNDVTGSQASSLLPTECAIRVTLNAGQSNGGPFFAGWSTDSVDADGNLTSTLQGNFADAVEDLVTALNALDSVLMLDKPSVPDLATV